MAEKINLRSSKVKEQKRRVADYGTETPLSSTAVERGSTRWLDGSRVVIEGLLDVTGLTTISGTLNVSGTTTLSGSTTIAGPTGITGALTIAGSMSVTGPSTFSGKLDVTGPLTVTGVTKLNGKTDIGGDTTITGKLDVSGPMATKGTLSVEGVTTLKNNLNVDQGRKITLGGLVLENQSPGSAFVQMPGGGIGADNTLGMSLNHNKVQISAQTTATTEAQLINLNAPQTSVNGKLVVTNGARFDGITQGAAGTKANVHMDSAGNLWRANE